MLIRYPLALFALTLLIAPASADPTPSGPPSPPPCNKGGRSRGYSRDHHHRRSSQFTSIIENLSRSLKKRSTAGTPKPAAPEVAAAPAKPAETVSAPTPEPAALSNPAQVPNPLAELAPVIAAPVYEGEADEAPARPGLSAGAATALLVGIGFGVLLLVGLAVVFVHNWRDASPKYRRPRRREDDGTDV
ncbi:MAG: hypothetical protein ACRC33_12125 [Gemmataceae bacterium]